MFYPARWKKITDDQSKVLKKSTVPLFLGHPVLRISYISILNCALQHHWIIITPALAELPMGAWHFKE